MERLTLSELRQECRERGLSASGKKKDLLIRLRAPTGKQTNESESESDQCGNSKNNSNSPIKNMQNNANANLYFNNTQDNSRNVDLSLLLSTLPPLKIECFSGAPADYPRFLSQFTELILNTPLSDSQKMTRLLQFVEGEAKSSIRFLEGMPGGIYEALKILKERFGETYMVVFSTINNITDIKSIQAYDKVAMRRYADQLRCAFYSLKTLDKLNEVNTSHLLKVVSKLPFNDQIKWRDNVAANRPKSPSFEDLVMFVQARANALNEPVFGNITNSNFKPDKPKTNFSVNNTGFQSNSRSDFIRYCLQCKGNHRLMDCEIFNKSSVIERKKFIINNKLCFNCLTRNHDSSQCRSKIRCLVRNCNKAHHTLLHENDTANVNQVNVSTLKKESSYMQVIPVHLSSGIINGPSCNAYALIDSGSETSFISKNLASKLQLKEKVNSHDISLSTLSGSNIVKSTQTSFNVSSLEKSNTLIVKSAIVLPNLSVRMNNLPQECRFEDYEHLKNLPLKTLNFDTVELIIGCNVPKAFAVEKYVEGNDDEPIGLKTALGWCVLGPSNNMSRNKSNFSIQTTKYESILEEQLKHLIKTDNFSDKKHSQKKMSIEDQEIIKYLDENTIFQDNQYVVPMIWNDSKASLKNNLVMVKSCTNYLKRRFDKDPKFFKRYSDVMDSYFKQGYARVIPQANITVPNEPVFYLPHHPVENDKKPDKLRIVFNAAAKFSNLSLNDCLSQGPDLTNSLIGVLCRFRQERVAITGDIESMFHRVKVTESDSNFLRFLWWKNGLSEPLVECQMCVHIFGAKCSPCTANYTLQRIAKDCSSAFNEDVKNCITKNFYVDDFLKSLKDEEKAKTILQNLRLLLSSKGFNLTKINSNSNQILNEHKSLNYPIPLQNTNETGLCRTLGLFWNPLQDCFCFSPSIEKPTSTKRGILSASSMLFDPLGFLAPLTIIPKIILQTLWRKKVDWDSEVDDVLKTKWLKWLGSLHNLRSCTVPRCLKIKSEAISYQLHAFSDASETAYGVCVYIRTEYEFNNFHVAFLFGKCRVAPLKFTTIPRLELQAAVLSANIVHNLQTELEYDFDEVYLWTDSMTTLRSITNEKLKLTTYVANRVSSILEKTTVKQWHYVPGKLNPSDDCSRGLHAHQFTNDCRWWNGPDFLKKPLSEWPAWNKQIYEAPIESKSVLNTTITCSSQFQTILNQFSDLAKLKKSIAWFVRFSKYLRNKKSCPTGNLNLTELDNAEQVAVHYVQRFHFQKEISALNNNQPLKSSSHLYKFAPFLDNEFTLRVGGRIKNAPIPYNQKHQIILPKDSSLSKLLLQHYHVKTLHAGKNLTIATSREKYWILKSKQLVNEITKKCIKCKRINALKSSQLMGELPASRVQPFVAPFTCCGVDLFGPLHVTIFRRVVKRWGVIFVCFSTKAIHLELCPSLEADDFLNTLVRFMSRRGTVREIWSDNGTNFTLANKILKDAYEQWLSCDLEKKLIKYEVKWIFNPPGGSHMGGLWERAIQSVKRALNILTNEQKYNEYSLQTYFATIEHILNDRPLIPLSNDPSDFDILTPNHFLMQRKSSCCALHPDPSMRKKWAQVQTMSDHFWKRWLLEYLPTLQKRSKWNIKIRNIVENDIVLISSENTPRGEWPLGRVTRSFSDKNGVVRTVELKTKNGFIKRPIHKLCLLEEA